MKRRKRQGFKSAFHNKGFSLVELLTVIVIIGILTAVAVFQWQKYVANSNLRTAARKVVEDVAKFKARAIAEGRTYTITINLTPNNNYNISAPNKISDVEDLPPFNLNSVSPLSEDSRMQDAQITAVNFGNGNVFLISQRGLVSPTAADGTGTITLTNSRNATATITVNSRGRMDVAFTGL